MPRFTRREAVAAVGCLVLALAVAALAVLEQYALALAFGGLLLGLVGGLVILTGASIKRWILKAEKQQTRDSRLAGVAAKKAHAASQRSLKALGEQVGASSKANEISLGSIERAIDALRFSQSVVTQALSTNKSATAETAELVRANQEQLEHLARAAATLADDLSSALTSGNDFNEVSAGPTLSQV